jgi:hypothetical protein
MKEINWEWYLQSACVLLEGDDKQFEWILGRLKVILGDKYINFDVDSSDYLFIKFRYRIISISYIKAALVLKHREEGIDENEFDDWNDKLQTLALLGNPNEHFTISGKSIQHIGLEKLKKPVTSFGKETMASFHSDSTQLVTLYLTTVSDTGEGKNDEVTEALINFYFGCFGDFIDGELEQEDANLIIDYIKGHFRGQTIFTKSLINT